MFTKIKSRLSSEQGFTLIELLVVIVILGILAAIAVPSYLSFRGRAQSASNLANVRSAIPGAESYYQNAGTYAGLSGAELQAIAPGMSPNDLAGTMNSGKGYCIQSGDTASATANDSYYYVGGDPGGSYSGPIGTLTAGWCASGFSVS